MGLKTQKERRAEAGNFARRKSEISCNCFQITSGRNSLRAFGTASTEGHAS